ncbi:uncharacterized protein METZ01_LOCUS384721 [marine metagenome]|uniref:Uncharacterized protein n=1 Tax=marine metagenome TaxID=408172 RepID=A0A382UCV4_9ZZZZ
MITLLDVINYTADDGQNDNTTLMAVRII